MWALDEPSRASATVWKPAPLAMRTQNVMELSVSGCASPFARTWNWPLAFERRSP